MYRTLGSDTSHAEKSSSFVETFLRTCIKRVIHKVNCRVAAREGGLDHAPPFYEFPAEILLNAHLTVRNACISFLLSPAYHQVPRMSLPFSRRRIPSISSMVTRLITRGAGRPQRSISSSGVLTPSRTSVTMVFSSSFKPSGSGFAAADGCLGSAFAFSAAAARRCSACCSRLRMSSQALLAAGSGYSPV